MENSACLGACIRLYPVMFRVCKGICVFDRFSHTENDLLIKLFPCIELRTEPLHRSPKNQFKQIKRKVIAVCHHTHLSNV